MASRLLAAQPASTCRGAAHSSCSALRSLAPSRGVTPRRRLQVRMARTDSKPAEIGTPLIRDIKLPDTAAGQQEVALDDVASGARALLVVFICNHCPFVLAILEKFVEVAKEFEGAGLATVAISSNSIQSHPQDGPDKMSELAKQYGFSFPYLYDESQDAAKAFGAVCTPDFFLYDGQQYLRYRGQFDDARPGNGVAPTGADLRATIQQVLAGKSVEGQKPSIGCSIKWHPDTAGGREDVSRVPE